MEPVSDLKKVVVVQSSRASRLAKIWTIGDFSKRPRLGPLEEKRLLNLLVSTVTERDLVMDAGRKPFKPTGGLR
jgi:hypothetical protein